MTNVSDFIKELKIDSCKHLSTGMRYANFVHWAGFIVPGFYENSMIRLEREKIVAMRSEISSYTQMRVANAHDIFMLFCYAISESITENVKVLNGTVNVDFLSKCRNATEFLDTVKQAVDKYSDKIRVRPFLGIDTDNENNLPLAEMLLESKLFDGIELYGTRFAVMPEKFLSLFNTAHRMNIDSRICCLGFYHLKSREEIFEILNNLKPTLLLNPNIAINNEALGVFKDERLCKEIVEFGKTTNMKMEFSPAPGLSYFKGSEKNNVIRDFAENGIPISLCTGDTLYLNKSLSEFATDLCNEGVFSKEEIMQIIKY